MTALFSAILATSWQHTCDTAVTQRHEYESTRRQRALRAEPYHPATGWTRQWADTAAKAPHMVATSDRGNPRRPRDSYRRGC